MRLRAGILLWVALHAIGAHAADMYVYFGHQHEGPGEGFTLAHFDTETGKLTKPQLISEAQAPSFFVFHPDGTRLYTTNFGATGGISAYQIDPKTGAMQLLNHIAGPGGGTSGISLDKTGKFALCANYAGGNLAVFRIDPDGKLGERTAFDKHTGSSVNPARQSKTYPHCIFTDPTNRFALAADLGLDKLFIYRFDETKGTLTPNDPPFVTVKPGSGPRHVRFHPNGKWVYLINEMGNLIIGYDWNSSAGTLKEFQTVSTLPEGFAGESTAAELEIHPNGRFLYGSNRGDDSIAVFAIDQSSGKMTLIQHVSSRGKTPRNFALDPTSRWMIVSNQDGNNACVYRIDQETGRLTPVGDPVEVQSPCCERFLPVPTP